MGYRGIACALQGMMKLSINRILVLSVLGSLPTVVGCPAAQSPVVAATGEDALASSDRKEQLDALRVRVTADFAGAVTLRDKKLVFVVKKLTSDAGRAAVFAHIKKRDAQGRDAELDDADYKGSVYEETIREGLFDGPEVTALLVKKDGKWIVMKKGDLEAYVVGPTDVAWEGWDREFGVPRSWLDF